MVFGSLFSGIGGIDLGLERAGMVCAWQVEKDAYARKVLQKNFPNTAKFDDIRECIGRNYTHTHGWLLPRVDLIAGGFPCQDISVAGKGKGLAGERSGLWREFARIVDELRPPWVLVENVPALRTRGLRTVLSDIHASGYYAEWDGISASAVGAPHRRDRIFVIAYARSESLWLEQRRGRCAQRPRALVFGCNGESGDVANTERESGNARGISNASEGERGRHANRGSERSNGLANADGEGELQQSGCVDEIGGRSRYLGFQDNPWSVEPDVGRTFDGVPPWLDRLGVSDETKARAFEVLRLLSRPDVSEALQRDTRGLGLVQAEEVLFSVVREFEDAGRVSRGIVAGSEASNNEVREMRVGEEPPRSSLRRGPVEQLFREHSDALRTLSRMVASRGETPWANPLWESAVPRIAHGVSSRVDRLRCLGNAVVPQVAEYVGKLIMKAKQECSFP